MILQKKVSWILLTIYFIFDNVVSYVGITRMSGRELNAWLAPFVEPHLLLYFLCIPAQILMIYITMLVLREVTAKVLRRKKIDKNILEKIILTSIVIFWPIANSSLNFAFILGYRKLGYLWGSLTLVGLVAALTYGLLSICFVGRKKVDLMNKSVI